MHKDFIRIVAVVLTLSLLTESGMATGLGGSIIPKDHQRAPFLVQTIPAPAINFSSIADQPGHASHTISHELEKLSTPAPFVEPMPDRPESFDVIRDAMRRHGIPESSILDEKLIAMLTDRERTVYLHEWQGDSVKVISEKLGVKAGTVKTYIDHVRWKIVGFGDGTAPTRALINTLRQRLTAKPPLGMGLAPLVIVAGTVMAAAVILVPLVLIPVWRFVAAHPSANVMMPMMVASGGTVLASLVDDIRDWLSNALKNETFNIPEFQRSDLNEFVTRQRYFTPSEIRKVLAYLGVEPGPTPGKANQPLLVPLRTSPPQKSLEVIRQELSAAGVHVGLDLDPKVVSQLTPEEFAVYTDVWNEYTNQEISDHLLLGIPKTKRVLSRASKVISKATGIKFTRAIVRSRMLQLAEAKHGPVNLARRELDVYSLIKEEISYARIARMLNVSGAYVKILARKLEDKFVGKDRAMGIGHGPLIVILGILFSMVLGLAPFVHVLTWHIATPWVLLPMFAIIGGPPGSVPVSNLRSDLTKALQDLTFEVSGIPRSHLQQFLDKNRSFSMTEIQMIRARLKRLEPAPTPPPVDTPKEAAANMPALSKPPKLKRNPVRDLGREQAHNPKTDKPVEFQVVRLPLVKELSRFTRLGDKVTLALLDPALLQKLGTRREIYTMAWQGYTDAEIAVATHRTEDAVSNAFSVLQQMIKKVTGINFNRAMILSRHLRLHETSQILELLTEIERNVYDMLLKDLSQDRIRQLTGIGCDTVIIVFGRLQSKFAAAITKGSLSREQPAIRRYA